MKQTLLQITKLTCLLTLCISNNNNNMKLDNSNNDYTYIFYEAGLKLKTSTAE